MNAWVVQLYLDKHLESTYTFHKEKEARDFYLGTIKIIELKSFIGWSVGYPYEKKVKGVTFTITPKIPPERGKLSGRKFEPNKKNAETQQNSCNQ